MPHKYFADQYDDEEVLMVFNQHPVVMRKGLILGMLAIALGTVPSFFVPTMTMLGLGLLGGFVLGGIIFFPSWMRWHFSVYIVTDRRFLQINQKGMFKKSVIDLDLHQIQMINYEVNGLQETLLGFGTMVVHTYMGDLTIKELHHPAKIQKEMLQLLRERGIVPVPKAADQEQEELGEE